ncbi:FkbM family methyltransferase [Pedobacter cryophilus]|uniref:FkbM family methyltransferase n=1 Tax=Pedobacter cryophilus TaxID=2571271 RepID=A0A4U1C2U6_9SPHI|nr:FkbM family methyltransferase [Pedobacter cryophilus]TKB98626.1 FkbM family methyltransferase [Pedobacter cryophilus]
MNIALTNLSDHLFIDSRNRLNISAKEFGISTIFSYDYNDLIPTDFYKKNSDIFSNSKGLGYWIWKPFIILEALKKLNDGDVVIYSDCGIEIINNINPLIDICLNKTDILLFQNSDFNNKLWTKRDCFILMDCDNKKYWDGMHCDAAFCLFKKSDLSIKFIEEWLLHSCNINVISSLPNICGENNFKEFIEHRWDQSILSLLAIKYNIELHRMPSQFGNHYKLSKYRLKNEFNCVNQLNQLQTKYYSDHPICSNYHQLLNHHRNKTFGPNSIKKRQNVFNIKMKNKINRLLKYIFNSKGTKNINPHKKESFSQCGEDLIIKYIFELRGITKPSYLDIGANDPFYLNNTAVFYKNGCRGINIEANPKLLSKFKIERPEDVNLNIGISNISGKMDFYIMKDDTLSTFSKEEYENMINSSKVLDEIKLIDTDNIDNVLRKYNNGIFPDFLSIDVEGLDEAIIKSINFDFSAPKIICVEAAEYSPIGAGKRRSELIEYLKSKGYYEYANTNLNAIMVAKEFWFVNNG